ncbi:FRG domain-containing protein [Pantoea endophytica]|uniref:FRG domain-containing protein n=1 Tax=Pantoea endophytica TaxID=92488 RepID=UPI001AE21379|nr:FRG domain-containing protein [Pantoea endophytica]
MIEREFTTHEARDLVSAGELWDALSPTKKIDPNAPDNIVYRGQGDANWKLIPSALRNPPSYLTRRLSPTADDIVASELLTLSSFVDACDRIGIRIPSDSQKFRKEVLELSFQDKYLINPSYWPNPEILDLMAMAQHHSVPTRLLDWTRLAYTAFYFAVSSCIANHRNWDKDSKLAIWAFNTTSKHLHPKITIHNSPGSISPHLAAQYGLFTVHPHNGGRGRATTIISLEELAEDLPHPIFFKYTLPVSEVFDAFNLMYKSGFTAADIYPSADGAGKAVLDEINLDNARVKLDELNAGIA